MLRTSLLVNVVGQVATVAVAIITVPVFSKSFGVERYGCYLFLITILPYFGLSDGALARTVMIQSARIRTQESDGSLLAIVSLLGCGISLIYALAFFVVYPYAAHEFGGSTAVVREVRAAAPASLGLVLLATVTAMQAGSFEGRGRFALSNAIQLFGAVATVVMPILPFIFNGSFDHLVLGVLLGRAAQALLGLMFLRFEASASISHAKWSEVRWSLADMGWLTLTSAAAIVSATIDRLLLGFAFGAAQLYFYAVPTSAAMRMTVIGQAVGRAMAPSLAVANEQRAVRLTALGTDVLVVALSAVILVLAAFAHDLLTLWVNAAFADQSILLFRLALVAMLGLSLAQVPGMLLQSTGRASKIVKLQLYETVPYVAAIYFGSRFGLLVVAQIMLLRQLLVGISHMYIARQSLRQMLSVTLLIGLHLAAIPFFELLDGASLATRAVGLVLAATMIAGVVYFLFGEFFVQMKSLLVSIARRFGMRPSLAEDQNG